MKVFCRRNYRRTVVVSCKQAYREHISFIHNNHKIRVLCHYETNESNNVSEICAKETISKGHFSHHEIWISSIICNPTCSLHGEPVMKKPSKKVGSINKLIFYKCVIKPFN